MLLNDRDQIIAMTAEWTGERYPNGRPRVSDEKIEILKNLTQEEIWQPLYSCGYRFQFQGDLKPLHPDKKLYGRAVTCCFMPQRPDLRQHVFNVARSRGWKGDCNQWVIDSLEESDVVVCDLYDKILRGTFVGGNLTTAVKARTKNGGVVVWGGVRCARKVIPTMQARGGGSIINISSIHSLMSQPTNMLYAGTKGAMNAAARVMALDYAKDNIRVNTICPGVVISDVMYDDMDKLDDAGKKQLDAALHRCQPLEPGRMQDIANTALFFASNMSANITGQTLLSDGGTSIKAHDMDC